MKSPFDKLPDLGALRTRRGLLWAAAGFVATLVVVSALLYWLIVPRVADRLVRERLAAVEKRADVKATYDSVETGAIQGVVIRGFRVDEGDGGEPLASIGRMRARLNLYHLAFGEPVVSAVDVREATLTVRRRADGSTNLERVLGRLRGGGGSTSSSGEGDADGPGLLRYFGGDWPDAAFRKASVSFVADDRAAPWPLERISVSDFQVDSSGATAAVEGDVRVSTGPGADPRWQIPRNVTVEGTLRLPVGESTGSLAFDRPLELVGLGPAPFLRLGVSRIRVAEGRSVELHSATAALQSDGEPLPFASVDRIRLSLERWPDGSGLPAVDEFVVDQPEVTVRVDRQHGSAINDLLQLTRAPVARSIVSRARRVARLSYLDIPRWRRPELEKSENENDASPGPLDRVAAILGGPLAKRLLPEKFAINGAKVHATDGRNMGLNHSTPTFGLREGSIEVTWDPESQAVEASGGFDAYGGNSNSRGALTLRVEGSPESGTLNGRIRVDALELSWVSQMLGASVARRIRGGTIDAKFESRPVDDGSRHEFSGFVRLDSARLALSAIAEKPIRDLDAGYEFSGYYDGDRPLPDPEYVRWRDLSWDDRSSKSDDSEKASPKRDERQKQPPGRRKKLDGPPEDTIYPKTGAVVVERGRASLNGIEATVQPALYGIDGLERRPTRFDLKIDLKQTDVQKLFEAVPESIRGPVATAEMRGRFGWDFDVEVPLYDAGEMEWKTRPQLRAFRLVSLPDAVDVRELKNSFPHVIEDERIKFRRKVTIPEMRPVSARYLLDTSETKLQTLDERRRRRGWPPPPSPAQLGPDVRASIRQTPEVWTTDAAEAMAAPKPWDPGQPLATVDPGEVPSNLSPVEYVKRRLRREPSGRRAQASASGSARGASRSSSGESTSSDTSSSSSSTGGGLFGGSGRRADDRPEPRPFDSTMLVRRRGRLQVHPYGPYVYVPLHHVSKWLPRAIMTTEDNSFFEHNGFNWFALENSVEENIEAGGFVRGGSTVSMQLIKNLYLSFDKVLARKLREAYLVWLMESVVDVPKSRILELYFNIIEFGPGIFGIHDAAVHYFGKRPDQLTLTETAFLVSVVPNPKKHHRFYERGAISDSWFESLMTYIEIMHDRDRATKKDVERARNDRPTFYKPGPGEPKLRPSARSAGDDSGGTSFDDFSTIFESSPSEGNQ